MQSLYDAVMNPNVNPLKNVPAVQRFQIMLFLSIMWTTAFCAAAGAWYWYGELVVVHVFFALGLLVTGLTFRQAQPVRTYRDQSRPDGTARYDDVWGA